MFRASMQQMHDHLIPRIFLLVIYVTVLSEAQAEHARHITELWPQSGLRLVRFEDALMVRAPTALQAQKLRAHFERLVSTTFS